MKTPKKLPKEIQDRLVRLDGLTSKDPITGAIYTTKEVIDYMYRKVTRHDEEDKK